MENTICLNIKGISKSFGEVKAVKEVSCTLEEGIYGLIGNNGAGKSTLIHMITTIMKPSAGTVCFQGEDIFKLGKAYRKTLGVMPQNQQGYEQFSGYQFLYYMASLKAMSKQEAKEQINALVDEVGLRDAIHRKVKTYSGGMRQRLMFIQAMLHDPQILILDEPTAGLDPFERIRMRNLIAEKAKGKIVIIATHVMQDVEAIASHIVLLKNGELLRKAPCVQLLSEMQGLVYEKVIEEDALKAYQQRYKISKIVNSEEGMRIRYVSDEQQEHAVSVMPDMEDVYLWYMV